MSTDVPSDWPRTAGIGPEVAAALRPHVAEIADAVLAAVMAEVPPFKEWREGSRNLREGVEQSLAGFLEQIEFGDDGLLPRREVYARIRPENDETPAVTGPSAVPPRGFEPRFPP